MKRLTSAYANSDLRDLLSIEMEWLGVEATNLANASEQKLKVYCMVLREQIDELKYQTMSLIQQPQYSVIHRFAGGFGFHLTEIKYIKTEYKSLMKQHAYMVSLLLEGGLAAQQMVTRWADDHARDSQMPHFEF